MTILFISHLFAPLPGSWGVCLELTERLEGAGQKVLRTSDRKNRFLRPLDMLSTIWQERGRYQAAHIDVFSGHAFRWAESSAWLLARLGKAFALTLHGGNLPDFARKHPRRVRRLLAAAGVVTVPSAYLQTEMAPYHGRLRLLPNPIDLARYPFRQRDRLQPRLIWLRALQQMYHPVMAVQVLARLLPRFPEMTLTMVGADKGDGSLAQTRAEARRLGVDGRIQWAGSVPKSTVPGLLAQHDIFLNTTTVDNTPISVLEALACGLCVVSTNAGGLPYLLTHREDALLVPSGDSEAMAEAVARLLQEPVLAAALSTNGRQTAMKHDWQQILPQWLALFQELVSR